MCSPSLRLSDGRSGRSPVSLSSWFGFESAVMGVGASPLSDMRSASLFCAFVQTGTCGSLPSVALGLSGKLEVGQ